MFKKVLTLIWLFLFLSSTFAVAAPTVASAQREVDKLRTLAAAKYEAANEATIRIKQLQAETTLLRKKEEGLRKELDASAKFLAQIAIARFKENGLGQGLELLFSADPTKYLSDASTLEVLSRGYSEQLREFEINKQRVEASQLVVSDRTALLKIQQIKLNREVTQAKAALLRAEKS